MSAERPEGSIFIGSRPNKKVYRRDILKGIGVTIVGSFVITTVVKPDLIRSGFEKLGVDRETVEQKLARKMLNDPSTPFFENLEALLIVKNDRKIPVKLRNRPYVERDKTDTNAGKVIDSIKAGTVISRAIVWQGNNPYEPYDKDSERNWFAFFNPKNLDEVAFSYSGNFRQYIPGRPLKPIQSDTLSIEAV